MLKWKIWIFSLFTLISVHVWAQKEDSVKEYIRFTIGSLGGLNEVEGSFNQWELSVFPTDKDSIKILRLRISVASINTGIARRDRALMDEEYFHSEKYPFIEVEVKLIPKSSEELEIKDLRISMKGQTKKLTLKKALILRPQNGQIRSQVSLDRYDWLIGTESSFSISRNLKVDFSFVFPEL